MNIKYVAEDGTTFNTSDECLAYEEKDEEAFNKWAQMVTYSMVEPGESLYQFLNSITSNSLCLHDLSDFWTYRRRFIELAKSFEMDI